MVFMSCKYTDPMDSVMGFGDVTWGWQGDAITSIQLFWKFWKLYIGLSPPIIILVVTGILGRGTCPPVVAHVFWIAGIWKYTINVHSNWIYIRWKGFNVYAGQLESTKVVVPSAILQCLWFQRNLPKNTKKRYISNTSANKVENSTVLFEYQPWRSVYTIKKQVTQNWNHLRFKKKNYISQKSTLVKMNIYKRKSWPVIISQNNPEKKKKKRRRNSSTSSPASDPMTCRSCSLRLARRNKKFTQNKRCFSPERNLGNLGISFW